MNRFTRVSTLESNRYFIHTLVNDNSVRVELAVGVCLNDAAYIKSLSFFVYETKKPRCRQHFRLFLDCG